MSVGDYLKQAAAQLRRAAQAQKGATQGLRKEISQHEHDINKRIAELKSEVSFHQRELNFLDNTAIKAERLIEINRRNDEIKELQKALDQEKTRVEREIQLRESSVEELGSQAANIERQASNANY